ncbi:MAG: 16S rRNA (cytidine(1402)-2'-O)-methyltransferase [Deltaproteobacteria bacterium]|nr:16S rRNA (cytidine(1402)-2'-O)-methyltransferase [Deltaproteobacteria bacterium]
MKNSSKMGPKVFIVATPLGNLKDCSLRMKEVLASVDLIACEDTRVTRKLLAALEIKGPPLISYYDQVEERRAEELIRRVQDDGISLAVLSDAGTPCIADPGYRLVKKARERGIPVIPIPGPSALATLISTSGLASDRVLFVGFLPRKEKALREEIQSWRNVRASIVAFETAKRLAATLELMAEQLPSAFVCVGRELTKAFEEIHTLPVAQASQWAKDHKSLKGELSLMIDPGKTDAKSDESRLLEKAKFLRSKGLSNRDIMEFFGDRVEDRKAFYKGLNLSAKRGV